MAMRGMGPQVRGSLPEPARVLALRGIRDPGPTPSLKVSLAGRPMWTKERGPREQVPWVPGAAGGFRSRGTSWATGRSPPREGSQVTPTTPVPDLEQPHTRDGRAQAPRGVPQACQPQGCLLCLLKKHPSSPGETDACPGGPGARLASAVLAQLDPRPL